MQASYALKARPKSPSHSIQMNLHPYSHGPSGHLLHELRCMKQQKPEYSAFFFQSGDKNIRDPSSAAEVRFMRTQHRQR